MTTEEFVGARLRKEYQDIWPVIRLLLYRTDANGKSGMFNRKTMRSRLLSLVRSTVYHGVKVKRKVPLRDSICLSNTMVKSERYLGLLEELYQTRDIVTFWTYLEVNGEFFRKRDALHQQIFTSRSLCIGESIAGDSLNRCAEKFYDMALELLENHKCCEDEYALVQQQLSALQAAVNRRVEEVQTELRRNRVKLFITVNQYNLDDLVIILACRKEGIWTKELCHHSNCICKTTDVKEKEKLLLSDNLQSFAYVHESCQWSKADEAFCRKHGKYAPLYKDFCITTVGYPEVTRTEIGESLKRYPCKDAIVYFVVPTIILKDLTANQERSKATAKEIEEAMRLKEEICRNIGQAAQKLGAKVYVRYHPTEAKSYRSPREAKLLEQLGFEELSSSQDDFVRAVCESGIAIGHETSAFTRALLYGCKCYNIVWREDQVYDFCGLNIDNACFEELADITFEKEPGGMSIDAIDIEALCAYPVDTRTVE